MTSSESLAIITDMIATAKKEAAGDKSFHLLLWGWVIALCNLGFYFLEKAHFDRPYRIWLLVVPAAFFSFYWGYRKNQIEKFRTYLDVVLNQIWLGVFSGICVVIGFKSVLEYNHSPIILILAAVGMFTTGSLVRVSLLKVGAVVLAIGAIISFLLPVSDQYLVSGIAMILGYLVPGYYLKFTYRERV